MNYAVDRVCVVRRRKSYAFLDDCVARRFELAGGGGDAASGAWGRAGEKPHYARTRGGPETLEAFSPLGKPLPLFIRIFHFL